jgi:hypothetical protein
MHNMSPAKEVRKANPEEVAILQKQKESRKAHEENKPVMPKVDEVVNEVSRGFDVSIPFDLPKPSGGKSAEELVYVEATKFFAQVEKRVAGHVLMRWIGDTHTLVIGKVE